MTVKMEMMNLIAVSLSVAVELGNITISYL